MNNNLFSDRLNDVGISDEIKQDTIKKTIIENKKYFDNQVKPILDEFFTKLVKDAGFSMPSYSTRDENRLFRKNVEVGRFLVQIKENTIVMAFAHTFMKTHNKGGLDLKKHLVIHPNKKELSKLENFLIEIYPEVKNYN